MSILRQTRFVLFLALPLAFAACGDDDGAGGAGGQDHGPVEEEACEHMEAGPSASVIATVDAGGAPAVAADHARYEIVLVDVAGGKGGSVSFAAPEAADFAFFLDADVPLAVLDPSGAPVAIETSMRPLDLCPAAIAAGHVVPLTVGLHTLTFGPTDAGTVRLIVEEAAHEDE